MRFWIALVVVLTAIFGVTVSFADCGGCKDKAACTSEAKAACSGDGMAACATTVAAGDKASCSESKSDCPMPCGSTAVAAADKQDCGETCTDPAHCFAECSKKVMAGTPPMYFVVGDKKATCPCDAEKLAEGDKSKIKFAVGEETFDSEQEALKAYALALDEYLNAQALKVTYVVGDKSLCCPNAAQAVAKSSDEKVHYRVAGVQFASAQEAKAAMKAAHRAADEVKMVYYVGEKKYDCPKAAAGACEYMAKADTCAKGDAKMTYAIGEMKTECGATAKVVLLRAKLNAAHDAAAKIAGTPDEGTPTAQAG